MILPNRMTIGDPENVVTKTIKYNIHCFGMKHLTEISFLKEFRIGRNSFQNA